MTKILLIGGALLLLNCGRTADTPPAVSQTRGDSIVLERTPCFGRCPAYRVRINRDGHVRFESRNPAEAGRVAEAQVDPAAVRQLFTDALSFEKDSLPVDLMGKAPYCGVVATDHSYVIVEYYESDRQWRVRDYLGCHDTMNEAGRPGLTRWRKLDAAIDTVAGTQRWILR